MARSAKQAKRAPAKRAPLLGGASALGAMIARNPVIAGGSTAFLVAFCYVSANAIWYQPHAHRGAFFPTRDLVRHSDAGQPAEPETTFLIERPAEPALKPALAPATSRPAAPSADATTAQVQGILKELGFYDGTVDGISGPATAKAIETYRGKVGLAAANGVDEELLVQLGLEPTTAGITPTPAPRKPDQQLAAKPAQKQAKADQPAAKADQPVAKPVPAAKPAATAKPEPAVQKADDTAKAELASLTKKVQAGLKAFGNEGIDVDGVMGGKTKNAIREFQSIFGLPVTGVPDAALYKKMRELGYAK
ncbi:peptidoglycan-binding domain-containing protein [Mesorhizobium sp. ASY16-5R]|uniref:peptidoglycan-binding domain-containing protein n=1 Tax=Mesorhizobium sp. ASY16-5R TaxID=3445772 RepID=UPI003FA11A4E